MTHAEDAVGGTPPLGGSRASRRSELRPVDPFVEAAAGGTPARGGAPEAAWSEAEHPELQLLRGGATRSGRRPGHPARRRGGFSAALREGVVVVLAALLLSLLVKTFLGQAYYIPSESMQQTLEPGDRVMVSLLTPGPFDLQRGDVVVFADPGSWLPPEVEPERGAVAGAVVGVLRFVGVLPHDSGGHLIKRVVGLPGDRVVCCDDAGRLTVNGAPVDETYLYPGDQPSTAGGEEGSDGTFDVTVPEDRVWVMGDHRSRSQDSRFHMGDYGEGTVPVDALVGRALVTVWPVPRWTWLSGHHEVFAEVPAADRAAATSSAP